MTWLPISLWSGGKPTLRAYAMVWSCLLGRGELEEPAAHLETLSQQP
jgi:hypothetical protein